MKDEVELMVKVRTHAPEEDVIQYLVGAVRSKWNDFDVYPVRDIDAEKEDGGTPEPVDEVMQIAVALDHIRHATDKCAEHIRSLSAQDRVRLAQCEGVLNMQVFADTAVETLLSTLDRI